MLQYDIEKKKFSELKHMIAIPPFQRGLVWSKDKKREFIKTLKLGLPIGVLLVSKSNGKYLVIDGLQRFTTMTDYSNDYFSYISKDEITDTDVMNIITSSDNISTLYNSFSTSEKEKVCEDIRNIIANNISTGTGKNNLVISNAITTELSTKIKIIAAEPDKMIITQVVYQIVDNFSKNASIDDVPIPLIVFNGSDDDLATIFQKLNQEGVKLSKYDVFAAAWCKYMVTVKDDTDFINIVIKKYDDAQNKSGLEISNYDPDLMKKTGVLTVFEYAYGVGKALMNKCKILFPKKEDSKVDSIGFLLLAELMGLQYSQMGQLAEVLVEHKNLNLKDLKNAILDISAQIEKTLSPYISAPTSKATSLVCHSELQLASYIVVMFKLKYQITKDTGLEERPNYHKKIKDMKENLHKHYLYDILRSFWSGSGDSKLEDLLSDPDTCRYMKDVSKSNFESVVKDWLASSNDKAALTNVSAENKLFLNYLLRLNNSIGKTDYDVEHCVPKKIIKDYIIAKDKDVPISAICNTVFIPAGDNRWKGEYTYYQKQKKDNTAFLLKESDLINYCYPSHSELSFVESTADITASNYINFLKQREEKMCKMIIDGLYK